MEYYHQVWLSFHPERTETWLKEKLAEGFDIHHIDGNHSNNDPSNLVLIEHADHMRFHGMTNGYRLRDVSTGPRITTLSSGERAYKEKQQGKTWGEIGHNLQSAARVYAKINELPWPARLIVAVSSDEKVTQYHKPNRPQLKDAELSRRIEEAKAIWNTMSRQEQDDMIRKQAEGWAKSEAQWAKDYRDGKCERD